MTSEPRENRRERAWVGVRKKKGRTPRPRWHAPSPVYMHTHAPSGRQVPYDGAARNWKWSREYGTPEASGFVPDKETIRRARRSAEKHTGFRIGGDATGLRIDVRIGKEHRSKEEKRQKV